jgi:anti-anti-sigma factor
MALTVTSALEDNFAILQLTGSLTLSPSLGSLRQAAKDALSAKRLSGMILGVSGITMTDSSGVGELTVIYTMATRGGCPLMLADVPKGLRNILEMTRLDALLPSADGIEAAKQKLRS